MPQWWDWGNGEWEIDNGRIRSPFVKAQGGGTAVGTDFANRTKSVHIQHSSSAACCECVRYVRWPGAESWADRNRNIPAFVAWTQPPNIHHQTLVVDRRWVSISVSISSPSVSCQRHREKDAHFGGRALQTQTILVTSVGFTREHTWTDLVTRSVGRSVGFSATKEIK